ncbi:MAG: hypothetical protein QOE35_3650 [Actinomycetota bacterium]|jgi:hypothetical protein
MSIEMHAARTFIHTNGRVLDRRVFATVFEGAPPSGVIDALRAYRNADGGFGHGLEPDKRAPDSQPLDTETAFEAMDMAGIVDAATVTAACDWLATVADGSAMVPLAFEPMLAYPHAEHWAQIPLVPGVNPTAGLAALLWRWGVDHPWREAATAGCWKAIEHEIPLEAHALKEALLFLDAQPDRGRAEALLPRIADRLADVALLQLTPSADYGVTPLHLAPTPDHLARRLFSDDVMGAFLDDLEHGQQHDGGWAISWQPPGPAAVFEWRAWRTLLALSTLRAWGRLPS